MCKQLLCEGVKHCGINRGGDFYWRQGIVAWYVPNGTLTGIRLLPGGAQTTSSCYFESTTKYLQHHTLHIGFRTRCFEKLSTSTCAALSSTQTTLS